MKRKMIYGAVFAVLLYLAVFAGVGLYVIVTLRWIWPGADWALLGGLYLGATVLATLSYVLPHGRVTQALGIAGNYWMCFQYEVLFVAVPVGLLDILLVRVMGVVPAAAYGWIEAGGLALALGLAVYGCVHARRIHVREISRDGARGLRVAHLTDLHLGLMNGLPMVRRAARIVDGLDADMVCITGDLFTDTVRNVYDMDEMARVFRGMKSRYGVYACLGNHDAGRDLPRMLAFCEAAGIRVLQDESVQVTDGVVVCGRKDATPGGRRDVPRMTAGELVRGAARAGDVVIVMDHQPGEVEEIAEAGADVLLCGHTHGGQFFPVSVLVRREFGFYRGWRKVGKMLAVVGSGTYVALPPMRIGSDAEIWCVEV